MDEVELIKRVAAGDERAFRQLYVQYHQVLRTHVFRLTESTDLADEVVQDVFLKVWHGREKLEAVTNFGGYLFILSKNLTIDLLRKHVRQTILARKWEQEETNAAASAAQEEPTDLYHALLDEAIDQLPPQQKRAYILSRHEQLKYAEIAAEMNISRETVKTYLQLAITSIKTYIRKKGHLINLFFLFFFR